MLFFCREKDSSISVEDLLYDIFKHNEADHLVVGDFLAVMFSFMNFSNYKCTEKHRSYMYRPCSCPFVILTVSVAEIFSALGNLFTSVFFVCFVSAILFWHTIGIMVDWATKHGPSAERADAESSKDSARLGQRWPW